MQRIEGTSLISAVTSRFLLAFLALCTCIELGFWAMLAVFLQPHTVLVAPSNICISVSETLYARLKKDLTVSLKFLAANLLSSPRVSCTGLRILCPRESRDKPPARNWDQLQHSTWLLKVRLAHFLVCFDILCYLTQSGWALMNNLVPIMCLTGSNSNMHSEVNPPLHIIKQHEKQASSLSWLSNIRSLRRFEFPWRTNFTWGWKGMCGVGV